MAIHNPASESFLTKLVVCSRCKSDLEQNNLQLVCTECAHSFPIIDDIPKFIELEKGDLDPNDPVEHRKKYEHRYQSAELARGYNESFENIPRDRKRTIRELQILNKIMGQQKKCESILDIPCGGGRLSPPLANSTNHLLEMDASLEQVKLALKVTTHQIPRYGASASALSLPLPDNSVDATLNARLSHHLPLEAERAKLLEEILRVSRRFVIFSFTDQRSTHSIYRAIRGKPINPSSMSLSEIEKVTARNGAHIQNVLTVFRLGSRHRFALLVKD